MKNVYKIAAAIIISFLAIVSLLVFLSSFSGHPPNDIVSIVGVWILPISFFSTVVLGPASIICWVAAFRRKKKLNQKSKFLFSMIHSLSLLFVIISLAFAVFAAGSLLFPITNQPHTFVIVFNILFVILCTFIGYKAYIYLMNVFFE